MLKLSKFLLLAGILTVAWSVKADSCYYMANRLHLGMSVSDPLQMTFTNEDESVVTWQGVLTFKADVKWDLLLSAGYYSSELTKPAVRPIVSASFASGGLMYKFGYEPDKEFVHAEAGLVYSYSRSDHSFYATIPDKYGNNFNFSETETFNVGTINLQGAVVVRLNNRIRLRGSMDVGRIIHSSSDVDGYITYIPGAGHISSSHFCARFGLALLVNVFMKGDCHQTNFRPEKEFTY